MDRFFLVLRRGSIGGAHSAPIGTVHLYLSLLTSHQRTDPSPQRISGLSRVQGAGSSGLASGSEAPRLFTSSQQIKLHLDDIVCELSFFELRTQILEVALVTKPIPDHYRTGPVAL